mmetsp:Transcript_29606/g.77971  ORF Transcript_29606/g.77971 Transcript_29606/m.77971 type:complete len:157 (+) Transcript_29606:1385-1855(+)
MNTVLTESMVALAKDVNKINGKVDRLAGLLARREARPRARAHRQAKTPRREPTQTAGAGAAAPSASSAALQAQLKAARAKAEAMAKKAAAYQQELQYEQAMPGPVYTSYSEPDHTTPFFGPGRSARNAACGALCKLRRLVVRTRTHIDKELAAAMH